MRCSKNSIRNQLKTLLRSLPKREGEQLRLAILGIGNELRGDDAAGILIARQLQLSFAGREDILVVDGGPAPENCTATIRRFAPHLVLLLDAAEMGLPPGTSRCLDWRDTIGFGASTHTLPPSLLANYLSSELDCVVMLLGIQPAQNEFDAPLSQEMDRAVRQVIRALQEVL